MSSLKSILIVDDDSIILVALREALTAEGFQVKTANNAKSGLEHVQKTQFSVIISDQRMPEMTGLEFFTQVKEIQPDASRILITGVLTLNTIIDAVNKGEIYRFIAKPWMREEMLATVHNAHQRFELLHANRELQKDTLDLNEELAQKNRTLAENIKELKAANDKLDDAHRQLRMNFEHSLDLCYRLIDAFHPLLGKETRSIVQLCQRMIDLGDFSEEEAHTLIVCAWLKNIGLIGVSREIILKFRNDPKSLTEEERNLIHEAPVIAQTLANFVDKLKDVGVTLRAQYEHWDGSGYPDGLAGELLPPMAKYLTIAAYFVECGLGREDAIERISEASGHAFEPEAVRLFLKATQPGTLPQQIKEILFSELKVNMKLARDIYSPTGILLLPEGREMDEHTLRKIKEYNFINPITQRILIYCN